MKRTLFSLFLLIFCALQGFAQGWNDRMWTGITGPVLSASTNTEVMNFTNEGFYNYVQINYAWFKLETWDLNHTEGMIFGSCYIDGYEDSYSMRIDGGRLTSISVGEYDDYLIEFSYNNLGQPTQVVMTEVHEGSMVCILKYSNYKTDAYGNWISRSVSERQETYDWWSGNNKKKVKTKNYTEKRSLTYIEGFREWNNAWPSVKQQGNLDKIAEYGRSALSTSTIRSEATKYWNDHIQDYVKNGSFSDSEILDLAYNPIASETVSSNLKNTVCERLYQAAMAEKDYKQVKAYADKQYKGQDILTAAYKRKINDRAAALLNEELSSLEKQATAAIFEGRYNEALKFCNKIKDLSPENRIVNALLNDAYLGILENDVAAGKATANSFTSYLSREGLSSLQKEKAGEMFADYALSKKKNYTPYTYQKFLQTLDGVPMPDAKRRSIEKEKNKAGKRIDRAPFVGFNIGYNLGASRNELMGGVEAGFSFGYLYQYLNFWIGAKYELNSGRTVNWFRLEKTGYLACNTLSFPAVLRVNFVRDNESCGFLGLGAEYAIPLKSRYGIWVPSDSEGVNGEYDRQKKSKDNAGKPFWAPRISVGYSIHYADIELFATYNLGEKYNVEHLKTLGLPNTLGNQFDQQTKGKFNIGFSLRFGF